jgi:hypothetical protein
MKEQVQSDRLPASTSDQLDKYWSLIIKDSQLTEYYLSLGDKEIKQILEGDWQLDSSQELIRQYLQAVAIYVSKQEL